MHKQKQSAFTVVELLIVIVIIGILATLTILAYRGVQEQAKVAAIKSDLTQASRAMERFKIKNAEQYPSTLAAASITSSPNISYQYSVNNSVSPATFCITAVNTTMIGTAYYVSNTQLTPLEGFCPGHSSNPGYLNLALNPTFSQTSGTVEVYRNLFRYPEFSSSYWQSSDGGATSASSGTRSGRLTRNSITGAVAYRLGQTLGSGGVQGVTSGSTYTLWFTLESNISTAVRADLRQTSNGGTMFSTNVNLVANTPQRVKVVGTITDTEIFPAVYWGAGGLGDYLQISDVVVRSGNANDIGAISGTYSPDSNLTASWAGTANASESTLRGALLSGWSMSNGANAFARLYQASEDGQTFARYNRPDTDSVSVWRYFISQSNSPLVGILNGEQVTLLFKARCSVSCLISVRLANGSGISPAQNENVTITTDWQEYRLVYNFTSDGLSRQGPYFNMQASTYPLTMDIDDVALVKGNYTGPFFQ